MPYPFTEPSQIFPHGQGGEIVIARTTPPGCSSVMASAFIGKMAILTKASGLYWPLSAGELLEHDAAACVQPDKRLEGMMGLCNGVCR